MEADYPHAYTDAGEHNHQGEKKSVLKKVKDKAKKIKDTIKHHGHDHEEEEDYVEEETVDAPRFISGTKLPKQTDLDLEKPAIPPEEVSPIATETTVVYDYGDSGGSVEGRYDHSLRNEAYGSKNPGAWEEMYDSNMRNEFRPEDRMPKVPDLQDDSYIGDEIYTVVEGEFIRNSDLGKFNIPQIQRLSPHSMEFKEASPVKIGPLEDLVEDPHRPGNIRPSNYQTKTVDPTDQGGKEADVSPLVQRLGNLHVGDESPGSEQRPFTGSHDQFAPIPPSKNPESPKTLDPARPESMPRDTIAGKISLAKSAIADKAVSAKNAVASKLGCGEVGVATGDSGGGESDKGVSVKEYLSEKLSPGEEDRALSEAITDAIHRRKGYKSDASGDSASGESTGSEAGVVGRVKGTVSSWLGMSGGTPTVDQDRSECRSGAAGGGGLDKPK